MIYRIFTENKGNIPEIVMRHFDGFTLTPGVGGWKGKLENSIIIEIGGPFPTAVAQERITKLVEDVKKTNNQETVLVQQIMSYDTLE